jgi:alginate O-acetyltransferase complex protein AlgI
MQNFLLLIASYFFYGWWDYRFLFLLIFSTLLDYYTGQKIYESEGIQRKRFWLFISVIVNLGFLGFFKYYNFFIDSFSSGLNVLGFRANIWTLKIILPVGISFYTFHGLSYVFDIYNGKFKPTRDFIDYSVFVSFFPLLVAGPIERATHLLPQVQTPRKFDYLKAVDGCKQILWGLFKKIVIADNCAIHANQIFDNYESYNGSTLVLGAVFFAFQIYGDFSGYSDIALGSARLLGFELLRNFAFPYFSRDIAEFWRRWHISLSSWFRDYVYYPLGGSRGSTLVKVRNTVIIFLLSGFWHGANWTFIIWGLLNVLYFIPLLLSHKNRNNIEVVAAGKLFPTAREFAAIAITFGLTVFAWIFFRAASVADAFGYIRHMFSSSILTIPEIRPSDLFVFIMFAMTVEWLGREEQHALARLTVRWKPFVRWSFYYLIVWMIGVYGGEEQQFIYFQF